MTATKKPEITYSDAMAFQTSQRGQYGNVDYNPVFRASALFFVIVNDSIDTHVTFMNYWREKNDNKHVSAMVTLRDASGAKIYRDHFSLEDGVYNIKVSDLPITARPFMGSVEVEIFSGEDLKFAMPAMEVFYISEDSVSCVHSNQRVFNNIEDMDRNHSLNPWQTGFDVFANDEYTGFVAFVNGPRSVPNASARLKVFNSAGEIMEVDISLGHVPAFSTRLISLSEIEDVEEFLGSDVGFCKIDLDNFGVFNRFVCGNFSRDESKILVTHSYYDCSTHSDYCDIEDINSDEYISFLPFVLPKDIDLDLVFYPIYAPSRLSFCLESLKPGGDIVGRVDIPGAFESNGTKMYRIDVRRALEGKLDAIEDGIYCLHLDEINGKFPMRMAFGLNYRKGDVGCNISASIAQNLGYGIRSRRYLWGPLVLRRGIRNLILVSHFCKGKNEHSEADIVLKMFGREGLIVQKSLRTVHGQGLILEADEILSEYVHYTDDPEFAWYTLESGCADLTANQIHITPSGFIGGDHSF